MPLISFGALYLRTHLLPLYEKFPDSTVLFLSNPRVQDAINPSHPPVVKPNREGIFHESLLLSSEELFRELGKDFSSDERGYQKARRKLFRYYIRMSSRCTPFGISGGVAVSEIGDVTSMTLGNAGTHRKYTRLSFRLMDQVAKMLMADEGSKMNISFYANNLSFIDDKTIRFFKLSVFPYVQSSIPFSALIQQIMDFAATPKKIDDIVAYIDTLITADKSQLVHLLMKLIDLELLVPDILPDLFSKDLTLDFLRKIVSFPVAEKIAAIADTIGKYNELAVGEGIPVYLEACQMAEELVGDGLKPFHLDLQLTMGDNRIGKEVVDTLKDGIRFLLELKPQEETRYMKAFCEVFKQRYGKEEVPLLKVLDEKRGIGFIFLDTPVPLSAMFNLPELTRKKEQISRPGQWDTFIAYKLGQYKHNGGGDTLELIDEDLKVIAAGYGIPDIEGIISCSFNLLAADNNAINQGNYQLCLDEITVGRSGNRKMARFGIGNGKIDEQLAKCAWYEEAVYAAKGVTLAEVNYLPPGGVHGDILVRKNYYQHEILLGTVGNNESRSFTADDLLVCCIDDRIWIRSASTGQLLLPRATTAYDHFVSSSCIINTFLSELQFQDKVNAVCWDWGMAGGSMTHFPRVVYKQCILSKAAWLVLPSAFSDDMYTDLSSWILAFGEYASAEHLPIYLNYIGNSDQKLLIDRNNIDCLQVLYAELKEGKRVFLEEFLFLPETAFLEDAAGNKYASEFCIALAKESESTDLQMNAAEEKEGERCLVGNLFMNPYLMDKLLLHLHEQQLFATTGTSVYFFERTIGKNSCLCIYIRIAHQYSEDSIQQLVSEWIADYPDRSAIWQVSFEVKRLNFTATELYLRWKDSLLALDLLACMQQRQLLMNYDHRLLVLTLVLFNKLSLYGRNEERMIAIGNEIKADQQRRVGGISSPKGLFRDQLALLLRDFDVFFQPVVRILEAYSSKMHEAFQQQPLSDVEYAASLTAEITDVANKLMYHQISPQEIFLTADGCLCLIKQEPYLEKHRNKQFRWKPVSPES